MEREDTMGLTASDIDIIRHALDADFEKKMDKSEFRWTLGILVSAIGIALSFQWSVLRDIRSDVQEGNEKIQTVAEDVSGIKGELKQLELIE